MKALKTIYGWDMSYEDVLQASGVARLRDRRVDIFKRFAEKVSKDSRFEKWFTPALQSGHDTRKKDRFSEPKVRTERLRKSPVLSMIRELNREANGG